jgi:hypothetical protein
MRLSTLYVAMLCAASALAQPGVLTKDLLIQYTPDWKGERFADGRPKVSDGILKRMKSVTLEEAWGQLRTAGFNHEYEDGWYSIHPDKVLVGRALTAQWLPGRPDIQKVTKNRARRTAASAVRTPGRWTCCSLATSTSATTSD